MKKLLLLLTFIGAGYFLFTAQNSPDKTSNQVQLNQAHLEGEAILNYFVQQNWYRERGLTPPVFDYTPIHLPDRPQIQNPEPDLVDGPDVLVFLGLHFQGENSIGMNEANPLQAMISTNGQIPGGNPVVQQTWFFTSNGGSNWFGSEQLPPGEGNTSYGDPVAFWSKTGGRAFFCTLGGPGGVRVGSTTDLGTTWGTFTNSDPLNSSNDDKQHAMTDLSGVYPNNVYTAWTDFGVGGTPIQFTFSTNSGATWSSRRTLAIGGVRGQGCDIATGPQGQVYVAWGHYGGGTPETGIGFAKSTDGGNTFNTPAIAYPINGIRYSNGGMVEFNNTRAQSFPDIDVDRSGGARNGWIYIVAPEFPAPATHDANVWLHRSTDGGATWPFSIQVNSDPVGRQQWMSSLSVDASNGAVCVSYFNMDSTGVLTSRYLAISLDGGATWDIGRISDVRFTPNAANCPNMVGSYIGDYYQTAAAGAKVLACWSDNRIPPNTCDQWKAYVSPYSLGPAIQHTPLTNQPFVVGTRAVPCVIIPAGSPINAAATKLFWRRPGQGSISDSVLMTNTSGNNWTANINIVSAGTYYYYIKTADNLGRIATSPPGAPGNLYSFIETVTLTQCKTTWVPIRDFTTSYDSMFVLANGTITDVNFRMDSLIHTFDGDVTFWIRSPAGTEVTLAAQRGGGGANYINTVFNDSAATPISGGSPPFTGSFRPETPLSPFNGQNLLGWWRLRVFDAAGLDTGSVRKWCVVIETGGYVVSVGNNNNEIPKEFGLAQNFPNPFNPSTHINFSVPKQALVKLVVYDILGRQISVLVNELKQPGKYDAVFDGANLSSGVYFYRIEAGDFTSVKKMILMK